MTIFPEGSTHGFGPKVAIFPSFFFLGNIWQENVFFYSLERKKAFLGYKNEKSKKSKNWNFSKGVNPWFWSKIGHFSNFLFRKCRPGKCLLRYSKAKKIPFWAIKKRSPKSRKIDIFPKGLTRGFGCIMASFPTVYFRQYKTEKCLSRYSRAKKRLSIL